MKKTGLTLLVIAFLVVARGVSAAPTTPAPAYYVHSDNPALKALFGVNHQFPGVFSTELSLIQLGLLKRLGVKTEPVQIYEVTKKPGTECGNGVCEPSENKNNCPQDCAEKSLTPTPTPSSGARSCYPESQTPWGIGKVNGGSGGAGVTVAVLDTGVDTDHPDLVGNIGLCVTKVTHMRPDTRSCEDGNGHGTHVSGTVLANAGSDTQGIWGVAPEASLMTVKVCDKRAWCYGDDIAAGIYYAADNGANIISMSFGGDTKDIMVIDAIDYAVSQGVLLVAAAGNSGPGEGSIIYPAAYVKVIAAGAIDINEAVPDWSSRGINDGDYVIEEREVEFGTPGVGVNSTWNDGCYHLGSGTSMATPHVSGLAAKLWQGTAVKTRDHLWSIARDIWEDGDDPATGFGLPIAPIE